MRMMQVAKKIACITVLFLLFSCGAGVDKRVEAGNFETLAATGLLSLNSNEKWEENYNTSLGKFKSRFRKLAFSAESKRYHLIIWWDGKRIADGYCPENGYGYDFTVFRDQATDRVFVAINSVGRVVLFGYDPTKKKMEKFVDSRNYYSPGRYPYMKVDADYDLELAFLTSDLKDSTRYKLFWDASANWFGYKDVTPRWQPPAPAAPAYTPPPVSYDYYEPASEEIYYEDEEVVGS